MRLSPFHLRERRGEAAPSSKQARSCGHVPRNPISPLLIILAGQNTFWERWNESIISRKTDPSCKISRRARRVVYWRYVLHGLGEQSMGEQGRAGWASESLRRGT